MAKIILKCERDVAFDSPDHLVPEGTKSDNSKNPRFNKRLYALYAPNMPAVLDLGCSGGGFVKDCIDDGCLAVGLEGSDFSKRSGRVEWATIPDNLFTCDISRDFQLYIGNNGKMDPLKFDVVTMWEVIEHIAERDLPTLCKNIQKHLKPGGLWIASVGWGSIVLGGLEHHQTVKERDWWENMFMKNGFTNMPNLMRHFNTQWVRGAKLPLRYGFNIVLTNDPTKAPRPVRGSVVDTIMDYSVGLPGGVGQILNVYWEGSPCQMVKRKLFGRRV
ncbi:MAG: methyltransferase domain-containing protein [Candidatus Omnitrophota bacterium]